MISSSLPPPFFQPSPSFRPRARARRFAFAVHRRVLPDPQKLAVVSILQTRVGFGPENSGQEADPVLPPSRFLSSPPASSLRFPLVPPPLCSAVTRSPPSPHLRPRTRGWEEGPLTLRESWQGPKGNPRSSSLAKHCLSEQKLISVAEDCPVYIPRDRHRGRFLAPDSGPERARLAAPWPRKCSCAPLPQPAGASPPARGGSLASSLAQKRSRSRCGPLQSSGDSVPLDEGPQPASWVRSR